MSAAADRWSTDTRRYVAVPLVRATTDALTGAQRQLAEVVRHRAVKLEALPTRALALVLDDLAWSPAEAAEAAQLALERVAARHGPFSVAYEGWSLLPSPEDGHLIAAIRLSDPAGRLARLRADLHDTLSRYGFRTIEGAYQPHLPLGRLVTDGGPTGSLLASLGAGPSGPVRISGLCLNEIPGRNDDTRGARTAPRVGPIAPLRAQPRHEAAPSEADVSAEIAAALDARLARRIGGGAAPEHSRPGPNRLHTT